MGYRKKYRYPIPVVSGAYQFVTVTLKYFLETVPLLSFTFAHISYVPALVNFKETAVLVLKSCFVVHEEVSAFLY